MPLENKVAAWMYAKETGQFQKVLQALKEQNADANKLLISHIQGIAPINPDVAKSLIKVNPHLADEIKKGLSEKTAKAIGLELSATQQQQRITLPIKILMELTPNEIVAVNPDYQNSREFRKFMARFAKVPQLRKFLEEGHPEAVEKFLKVAQRVGLRYFRRHNPPAANYFSSSAARALGIKLPP